MNGRTLLALTSLVVVLVPALALGQAPAPSPSEAVGLENQARQLQLDALKAVGLVLLDPSRPEADRVNAATAFVRSADRTGMPLLLHTLLNDPFPSVRRVVAEGLDRLQAPESRFALREAALSAPIDSVRWAAGVSLVRVAPDEGAVIDALLAGRNTLVAAALSLQNADAVAALPAAFHPAVVEAFSGAAPLDEYNSVERAAMLKSLAALGADETVPLMRAVLADASQDPFVRGAAAFSLGTLGASVALPELHAALSTGLEALQVGAAVGLQRLADPTSLDPLSTALAADASAEIRAASASALGALGAPAEAALLAAFNTDPDPAVRQAALAALVAPDAGASAAVADAVTAFATGPYLTTCDPSTCSPLALTTMSALVRVGQAPLAVALLRVSLDALSDVLPFVFAFAEEDLLATAAEVGRAAPEVFDLLLHHDNAYVQAIGLGALPDVFGEAARDTLLPFTDPEANRLLRRMAFEGLSPTAQTADVPLLLGELENRDRRTRAAAFSALARIGDARVFAPFEAALASDDLSIRLQAVEAAIAWAQRILGPAA